MSSTSASLHAGLLARKGEARPSAPSQHHGAVRSGNVATLFAALARREPLAGTAANETAPVRRIELPRAVARPTRPLPVASDRRQVHARIESDLHLRMRIAAARGGRTQQDLIASALESYLSFLDEDVYSPPCGATNAGV